MLVFYNSTLLLILLDHMSKVHLVIEYIDTRGRFQAPSDRGPSSRMRRVAIDLGLLIEEGCQGRDAVASRGDDSVYKTGLPWPEVLVRSQSERNKNTPGQHDIMAKAYK